jgi:hypothetical protein
MIDFRSWHSRRPCTIAVSAFSVRSFYPGICAFAPLREVPQPEKSRFCETKPIFDATNCRSERNAKNSAINKTHRSLIRRAAKISSFQESSSPFKVIQSHSNLFKHFWRKNRSFIFYQASTFALIRKIRGSSSDSPLAASGHLVF